MKVCIVYICTGKYDIFFEDFYKSSEEFFLKSCDKKYFVWTESNLDVFDKDNVVKIHQERLGWPLDTLMRFNLFSQRREELLEFDYVFFFNANMQVVDEISESEILPDENDNWLVSVEHPGYPNLRGPLEMNVESTAYVEPWVQTQYRQGCLYGGTSKAFVDMIDELSTNVNKDLEKGIIADVWDESHMNKYFIRKKPKTLSGMIYAYPNHTDAIKHTANYNYSGIKKCVQLDKTKFGGGHQALRS